VIDAVASSYASAKLALQAQLSAGLASVGTLTANGATPVTVTDANIKTTSIVMFGLNTVGGTVGAIPTVKTITAGTSFTVAGTASDTSIYNYAIINPVAN
jgi:hypothetical protein